MAMRLFRFSDQRKLACLLVALGLVRPCACAQASDGELARLLADRTTQAAAIESVVASGSQRVPALLRLAQSPPTGVNRSQLKFALIELFGRLKVERAIPYLTANINYRPPDYAGLWTKEEAVVIDRSPSIRALLRIGPKAIPAVQRAYSRAGPWDRVAIVFTLAQFNDAKALPTLQSSLNLCAVESRYAERGVRRLGEKPRARSTK